jgi:hypothetical protein
MSLITVTGTFETCPDVRSSVAIRGIPDMARTARFVEIDPGCVKTCASRECAELFSPLSPFDRDCQCCSFPIQRNRDKISTCKFDIGVFTQPGSKAEVTRPRNHAC